MNVKLGVDKRTTNVKPTFFQDQKLSFTYFCPKKLNIFIFEAKFIIKPKHFLSDLQIFYPKQVICFDLNFLSLQKVLFDFRNL
jgi:hypothetical protein